MNFDLISIGDTTVDVFLEVDIKDTKETKDETGNMRLICFEYGSKIPVKKMTRVPAVGNAPNNAIGSSRLGLKTALYTMIGADEESIENKKIIEEEDVDTSFVITENGKTSNFSTIINYGPERNIFVYHVPRNYSLPDFPQAKWIYYSSIAEGHDILHTQIPGYINKSGAKLGFNPGSYQLREGLEALKPILEATELLLLNREEMYGLVGGDIEDTKGLMKSVMEAGPKMVVLTDGRKGSFATPDGREFWHAGIPEDSPVVERTGAGDAYSTGFLAALILGKDLPDCMLWGTMNATSVVQFIGGQKGLLTQEGMKKFIEKYGEFVKPKIV